MDSAPTKIFIVDDHPLVREWLSALLAHEGDLEVCGGAADAEDALRGLVQASPDVVIVDLALPGLSGLALIKAIRARSPDIPMIVLSMHEERFYAERSIRAGARGYVNTREPSQKIVSAIRQVRQGKLYISDTFSSRLAERFLNSDGQIRQSPIECLSDRELEVFNLLGSGLETRQIAENLNISIKTIQTYCARIKEKLELTSAVELMREAMRWCER
jgi:DNA-binding NarL/FixJ family response regulator